MEVKIRQQEEKTIVELEGRIDSSNAEQFQQDLGALMKDEHPNIDIDCSSLTYISSQGLRVFLLLQQSVIGHEGSLVVRNMTPHVKEVFDITGFSNIITIL